MKKKSYHHGDLAAELLRSAELELAENGVESFSLRAVAKRSGVSHGAPAHHFSDARGLLTALAANGYERLVAAQKARQQIAAADPKAQLMASGLGYIDFAQENPALFRLMFSSEKPERENPHFAETSKAAFDNLVSDVGSFFVAEMGATEIGMKDVMASWSIAHGMADLIISGRAEGPLDFAVMSPDERDAVLVDIFSRVIGIIPQA